MTDKNQIGHTELIFRLQDEARKILDALIPDHSEVILLDYPHHPNVGDSLIWLGEIAYLKSRGILPKYVSDFENYSKQYIRKILNQNTIILLHGGGNFGTIWKSHHQFRLQVLKDFPNTPIIQFPQTIMFDDDGSINETVDVISQHSNFTLLVRSHKSLKFAQEYFLTKCLLCPDMAFFVGPIKSRKKSLVQRFFLLRTDSEKSSQVNFNLAEISGEKSYLAQDWLDTRGMEHFLFRFEMHSKVRRVLNYFDPSNQLLLVMWNFLSKLRMRRGVEKLCQGEVVVTDRLHAHILSILLNKPHVLLDNSYGKLLGFFSAWTKDLQFAKYVTDQNSIASACDQLSLTQLCQPQNIDSKSNGSSTAKSGLAGGVFWSVIRSWGTRFATVLVFFILTRLLKPEEIGLISYILGWLALLLVVADLGLGEYIVYNHQSPRSVELGIWWFQVGLSLLLTVSLIALLFCGVINPDATNEHSIWAMVALSLTLPLSAAAKIPEALLRRQMDYKGLAIRSLAAISVSSIIAIVLAIAGFGLWCLVVKQLVEVIIDTFYCFKLSRWRPSMEFNPTSLFLAFKGGWGIVSSRLLDVITQTADTLIIGSVFGMKDLGFYSMAKKVFQVLNDGVVQSVTGVIASAYGRVKEDKTRFKRLFLNSIKFASLVTVPVFVAVIALSPELIPLVFGQKWASAAPVAQMLCLTGLMAGYGSLNGFVVLANNENKLFFTLMLVNTAISLGLLAFLSQFGLLATAGAGPLKTLIILPLGYYFARKVIRFSVFEYMTSLKPAMYISLYMALAWVILAEVFRYFQFSEVVVAVVEAIVIFVVMLASMRLIYWQELLMLRKELGERL